jgi:DNA-binding YbaB/EbfC family protein
MSDAPDLGKLLAQAQEMMAAQADAAEQVVTGQAGGGAVRIQVTGGGEFQSVTISPEAVDPDDVEMLQDLVLAALHDASAQVQQLQQGALGGMMGDLGLDGLLGGGGSE